jgi:hypothetical protein
LLFLLQTTTNFQQEVWKVVSVKEKKTYAHITELMKLVFEKRIAESATRLEGGRLEKTGLKHSTCATTTHSIEQKISRL